MLTESSVRSLCAAHAIDNLGTDPASVERVAHIVEYTGNRIACCNDPDVDAALLELQQAYERWCVRLCEEDTGPVERVELRDVT